MIKLNGTTYLTYQEVATIVDYQISKFSTSQHAVLPQDVSYVDAEFVSYMRKKEADVILGLAFLYKNEEYATIDVLVGLMVGYLHDGANTSSELNFLNKSLTSLQIENHRKKYEKYLLNVLIDEILKSIRNK
jgi:hypothetical protein